MEHVQDGSWSLLNALKLAIKKSIFLFLWKGSGGALLNLFTVSEHIIQDNDNNYHLPSFHYLSDTM